MRPVATPGQCATQLTSVAAHRPLVIYDAPRRASTCIYPPCTPWSGGTRHVITGVLTPADAEGVLLQHQIQGEKQAEVAKKQQKARNGAGVSDDRRSRKRRSSKGSSTKRKKKSRGRSASKYVTVCHAVCCCFLGPAGRGRDRLTGAPPTGRASRVVLDLGRRTIVETTVRWVQGLAANAREATLRMCRRRLAAGTRMRCQKLTTATLATLVTLTQHPMPLASLARF